MLSTDDNEVFLVDIRPEATREDEGLPELKLGARFKVAAYPLQTGLVPKQVAKQAANLEELNLLINAAYIAGLCVVCCFVKCEQLFAMPNRQLTYQSRSKASCRC